MTATSSVALRANQVMERPLVRSGVAKAIRAGGLYPFLDLLPTTPDYALLEEAERKIHEMEARLANCAVVSPDERFGLRARRRLRTLLSHPKWRVAYDFRHGFVRAGERIAMAATGEGPPVEELHRIWQRVNPDLAARAADLLKYPSSSALVAAAPLSPFHPRVIAIAKHGISPSTTEPAPEWEGATTPMRVTWDGGGSACGVSTESGAPTSLSMSKPLSSPRALREAMKTRPDGLWIDLQHFHVVEIVQSVARPKTIVEAQLCHGGVPAGLLVLDDRVVVHATINGLSGEPALFAFLAATSGELFVRCGKSSAPRDLQLHLEMALVRYFQDAGSSTARTLSEHLAGCDGDESEAAAELVVKDVTPLVSAPSRTIAAAAVPPPLPAHAEPHEPEACSDDVWLHDEDLVLLEDTAASRYQKLGLTLAFAAGAFAVLFAGVLGAALAYLLLSGVSLPEPPSTLPTAALPAHAEHSC